MSMKRTSAESNNDDQTNEDSTPPSQTEGIAKRVKLDPMSITTLQDLPIELLGRILVRAIAMEVIGLRLAKSVWSDKADLVVGRLETVCSQWNCILSTSFFRNKLHRTLDDIAEETIRLEVLHESQLQSNVWSVAAMNDDVFTLCRSGDEGYVITVYNRSQIAEVKAVIPLPPKTCPLSMAACSASGCVLTCVADENESHICFSIVRISGDSDHRVTMSPWISDHRRSISLITCCATGSLITISDQRRLDPLHTVVSVYDSFGSLQHEILLSTGIIGALRYHDAIQKSNGNLVLGYGSNETFNKHLLEIDTSGSVVRQSQISACEFSRVSFADVRNRIVLAERTEGMELLDSEFNLMGRYCLPTDEGKNLIVSDLQYDREKNEILRIHYDRDTQAKVLTIFRLKEE